MFIKELLQWMEDGTAGKTADKRPEHYDRRNEEASR